MTKIHLSKLKFAWHIVEENPFEIVLSVALILIGFKSAVGRVEMVPILTHIDEIPVLLAIAYCALSFIGGAAVIFGLFARMRFLWADGVERFGLYISASAWASYVVAIILPPNDSGTISLIFATLALSIGCLLRAHAVNKNSKSLLCALRVNSSEGDNK